jgi:hypothetical protein
MFCQRIAVDNRPEGTTREELVSKGAERENVLAKRKISFLKRLWSEIGSMIFFETIFWWGKSECRYSTKKNYTALVSKKRIG